MPVLVYHYSRSVDLLLTQNNGCYLVTLVDYDNSRIGFVLDNDDDNDIGHMMLLHSIVYYHDSILTSLFQNISEIEKFIFNQMLIFNSGFEFKKNLGSFVAFKIIHYSNSSYISSKFYQNSHFSF